MKKSTYQLERAAAHRSTAGFYGPRGEQFLTQAVAADVAAAEAAGKVWDPEEEPLPERLRVGITGAIFACSADGTEQEKIGYVYDKYKRDGAEAARRYNLFPRIVKALSIKAYSLDGAHYRTLVNEALRIAEEEG